MIIDLEKRRTTNISEFENSQYSPDSKIFIEPLDCVIEGGVSLVINAGDHYYDQLSGAHIPFDSPINLNSRDFIVIDSKQKLKLPRNVFGLIFGKGNALFRGIMVAPGKIDPTFRDNLRIYIFNAGRSDVIISKGDIIASVVFMNMESTYDGDEIGVAFPSIPKAPTFFGKVVLVIKRFPRWVWFAIGGILTGALFVLRRILW